MDKRDKIVLNKLWREGLWAQMLVCEQMESRAKSGKDVYSPRAVARKIATKGEYGFEEDELVRLMRSQSPEVRQELRRMIFSIPAKDPPKRHRKPMRHTLSYISQEGKVRYDDPSESDPAPQPSFRTPKEKELPRYFNVRSSELSQSQFLDMLTAGPSRFGQIIQEPADIKGNFAGPNYDDKKLFSSLYITIVSNKDKEDVDDLAELMANELAELDLNCILVGCAWKQVIEDVPHWRLEQIAPSVLRQLLWRLVELLRQYADL